MGSTQTFRRRHRLRTIYRGRHSSKQRGETTPRTTRPRTRTTNRTPQTNRHRIAGRCMALYILLALPGLLMATPVQASSKGHDKYGGILPDDYYSGLARCETNSNWNHSTKSYTGGLGIYRPTFQRWSNRRSAKGMTPAQQVKVADAIAFRGHTRPDGTHKWRVGPWGWGCLKARPQLQAFICRSQHPLVRKWKRNC